MTSSSRSLRIAPMIRVAVAAACATFTLSAMLALSPAMTTAGPTIDTARGATIPGSTVGPATTSGRHLGQRAWTSIVGGSETTADKYPWMVQLRVDGDAPEGEHRCGGSLVHPMVILTAAHCFFDNSGNFLGSAPYDSTFTAFRGRTLLDSGGAPLALANFYRAPDYNGPAALNDYALVTLANPVDGPTIKIAGPDERSIWKTGRTGTTAGWGLTAIGSPLSPVLREVDVPVVSDSICASNESYGSLFQAESMLCAGFMEGGKDSCFGDSGGPLYAPIDGGSARLIGIVSTGLSCAEPNLPGIYTRIADPEISSSIASMIAEIEVLEDFPLGNRGLPAVGSGAKPPGCGAASRNAARARAAFRSAGRKVARAKKVFVQNQIRLRKASGNPRGAIKRLGISRRKLKASDRSLKRTRAAWVQASTSAVSACS